jgi:transposase
MLEGIPKGELIYIDESGIEQFLCRPYARSFRGHPIYGQVSGKRYERENFIAAKVDHKIFAPLCYKGTCNTVLFNMWIEKMLVPELHPGQIVIMDNAAFHKSARTRELIEQRGCRLVFLPPYSPDLNPIEKFWAHFKHRVRSILNQFETLSQAIDHAFIYSI